MKLKYFQGPFPWNEKFLISEMNLLSFSFLSAQVCKHLSSEACNFELKRYMRRSKKLSTFSSQSFKKEIPRKVFTGLYSKKPLISLAVRNYSLWSLYKGEHEETEELDKFSSFPSKQLITSLENFCPFFVQVVMKKINFFSSIARAKNVKLFVLDRSWNPIQNKRNNFQLKMTTFPFMFEWIEAPIKGPLHFH